MSSATAAATPIDKNAEKAEEKAAHIKLVEVQRQEQGKYLAANPTEALGSGAAIGSLQSVYFSNIPKQFEWGKSLSPQGAFSLAMAAAQTGLNPLLGQILMLGGQIYLTEKGCHHIANTDQRFDGYELEPVPKSEFEAFGFKPDEIAFKCSVYRKDRSRPTVAYGRASKVNVSLPAVRDHWLSEMAQKRSIQRAMIRAFALPFSGADESQEDSIVNVTPTATVAVVQSEVAGLTGNDRARLALAATKAAPAPKWISSESEEVETVAAQVETVESLQVWESNESAEAKTQAPPQQASLIEETSAAITIDPKILDAFKGAVAETDIRILCDIAGKVGMTGAELRNLVKETTGGAALNRETCKAVIDAVAARKAKT
jgi:hypothetical protein